ncbi:MAG: baseplate J/gp47 family protein [Baekduia sp.]
MADLLDFLPLYQEDASTVRARLDADVNAGLDLDDPRWVDTREGTFYYDITQVVLLELVRLWDALSVEVPAAAFVAFAWGPYLDAHAQLFNLERKEATPATGFVTVTGTPGTVLAAGSVFATETATDDADPIEFVTDIGGTLSAGLTVPTGLTATPTSTGGTLPAGTYYYYVTALSAFGETTSPLAVSAAVTGSTSKITLDWADVAGAVSYSVYRTTVSGGVGQRIYNGAPSTFIDTNAAVPSVLGPPQENNSAGVTVPITATDEGVEGNVSAFAITEIESGSPALNTAVNAAATVGGTNDETDEELRARILLEFEGRGAGNINDYRRWALSRPGVGRFFVNPVYAGPGTVQVVLMTSTGDPVSGAVVTDVQAFIDPLVGTADGEAPPGVTVNVTTPATVAVSVVGVVAFKPGYSLDGTSGTTAQRALIVQAITDYIDSLEVGEDVIYDHVKAQFFRAPGVLSISGVTVNAGTADVALTSVPPQVASLNTPALT